MQVSAQKVKQLRTDNGWSQELLGKASGLSLRTVQRVEKGDVCSAETQLGLAAAFIYGAAFIGILVGSIAIHASAEAVASTQIFHAAYAVNILILLYAAIIAEGLFRPLAAKLESRSVVTKFDSPN